MHISVRYTGMERLKSEREKEGGGGGGTSATLPAFILLQCLYTCISSQVMILPF